MAKPLDIKSSPLFAALRESMRGPDDGLDFSFKSNHLSPEAADLFARLYAAGGARGPVHEFMATFVHQVLSQREHAMLASVPIADVKAAKDQIYRITPRKQRGRA